MPRQKTIRNPAFGNIPAQTATFGVPEEGEIFQEKGGPDIYAIKGGKLLGLNKDLFPQVSGVNRGTQVADFMKGAGLSGLSQYNIADVVSTFGDVPGQGLGQQLSPEEFRKAISGLQIQPGQPLPTGDIQTTFPDEPRVSMAGGQNSGWIDPATGRQGTQISDEADLQAKREQLASAGIPENEWSKYISSPKPGDPRLFFSQPATLTSPVGEKKIVATGSTEASNLLAGGWTLGDKIGGGTVIDAQLMAEGEGIDISGVQGDKFTSTPPSSTIETSKQTSKSIQDYLNLVAPETDTSKEVGDLTTQVSELLGETAGREELRQQTLEEQGITELKKNLTSINNEIGIKTAALEKRLAEIQATPMTLMRQTGAEAAARRVAQSDIMFLQAQAQAMMNNISFANEIAQDAVDAKYNPLLEDINIKVQQLELLEGSLNKEEKNYANALNLFLADQQTAIADRKALETSIQNIKLQAISSGITDASVLSRIGKARTLDEATQILGENIPIAPVVSGGVAGISGGGFVPTQPIPEFEPISFDDFIQNKIQNLSPQEAGIVLSNTENYRSEYDNLIKEEAEVQQTQGIDLIGAYAQALNQGQTSLSSIPNALRNEVVMRNAQIGGINTKLSETAIKQIAETQNALDGLVDLNDKVAANLEFMGPIKGLQKLNPWSRARQIQADIDRIRQKVGKALEGGVLRKEDEEKYKKILATITDTPETAEYKIRELINDIQTDFNRYIDAQEMGGRYTGGFTQEAENDPLGIL